MVSKLSLMDKLSCPPISSCLRSRNKSGDIARSQWSSCLSFPNMGSKLSLMHKLSCPPISSGLRSRNKSGDISRSQWSSCLSFPNMVSNLSTNQQLLEIQEQVRGY